MKEPIKNLKKPIKNLKEYILISKNAYIDKCKNTYIVNKFNNTYYSTIKMKPVDVKSNTNIDSSEEMNEKDPKFKIGDTV